jgi:hypothetical protein
MRDGCKELWSWSLSLCGSSLEGTCREGSIAGDPEGYVEKALQTGISFYRGPTGEPGRGLTYCDFERWMKGLYGWSISLLRGSVDRASREGSFTGDPGRYVKKGSGYGHLSP